MWKLYIGILLTFSGIVMPLGIALLIFYFLDRRKKSIGIKGWTHKSFINKITLGDLNEHSHY